MSSTTTRRPRGGRSGAGAAAGAADATARLRERARRRRWRLLRRAAVATLALGALAALGWVVLASPVLGVHHVRVTGVHRLSADDVRRAAAVPPGQPLATLDTGDIRKRVEALPAVAGVRIHRQWPQGLQLTVTERTAVARVATPAGERVIDGSGVVFGSPRDDDGSATLPSLDVPHPGPGDATTRAALSVLRALPAAVLSRVTSVEAPTAESVTLHLGPQTTVIWGDASQSGRKAQVLAALLKQPGSVYDVSSPDVAVVH